MKLGNWNMVIWGYGEILNVIESALLIYNNELKLFNKHLSRNKLTLSNQLSSSMIPLPLSIISKNQSKNQLKNYFNHHHLNHQDLHQ